MGKIKIAPSILSCDFANFAEEIKAITKAGADYIHIDIMDGHFVPNLTIGPVVVKSIRPYSDLVFDVHLMIENVGEYIKQFAEAGADSITFHMEATQDSREIIRLIRSFGKKVGISIKPNTPASLLMDIIDLVDMVLVMTVEPGFGGQKFLESQLPKIKEVRAMIEHSPNPMIDLEVDGGINDITAKLAIEAGANVLVTGAYIFGNPGRYQEQIASLRG